MHAYILALLLVKGAYFVHTAASIKPRTAIATAVIVVCTPCACYGGLAVPREEKPLAGCVKRRPLTSSVRRHPREARVVPVYQVYYKSTATCELSSKTRDRPMLYFFISF